jgi:hypothetical protein
MQSTSLCFESSCPRQHGSWPAGPPWLNAARTDIPNADNRGSGVCQPSGLVGFQPILRSFRLRPVVVEEYGDPNRPLADRVERPALCRRGEALLVRRWQPQEIWPEEQRWPAGSRVCWVDEPYLAEGPSGERLEVRIGDEGTVVVDDSPIEFCVTFLATCAFCTPRSSVVLIERAAERERKRPESPPGRRWVSAEVRHRRPSNGATTTGARPRPRRPAPT